MPKINDASNEAAGANGPTLAVIHLSTGSDGLQIEIRRAALPVAKSGAKALPHSGSRGRHPETAWELVLAQLAMILFVHDGGDGPLDETVRFSRSQHPHRVLKRDSKCSRGNVKAALRKVHFRFGGSLPDSKRKALDRAQEDGVIARKFGARFGQAAKLAEWEEVAEQYVLTNFPMTVPPRDG